MNLGLVYYVMKMYASAFHCFNVTINLNPEEP